MIEKATRWFQRVSGASNRKAFEIVKLLLPDSSNGREDASFHGNGRGRWIAARPILFNGVDNMKITIESDSLVKIANDIAADCAMLGYVDEESIDDVDFYKTRIEATADDLRTLAETAAPAGASTQKEG